MKLHFILTPIILLFALESSAQNSYNKEYRMVDSLFIQGDYRKLIDVCSEIVKKDSLNAEIYYKIGLAYQNLMLSEKSLSFFSKAANLSPNNDKYRFALGKTFYSSGKLKLAEPLFLKICVSDSLNWVYAYYLSDIYMQKSQFKKAMPIYERFYKQDSTNTLFLDKMGFCNLRMGELDTAQYIFEKSLSINGKNIPTIKNLSYIYNKKNMIDTAIYMLNQGIKYDSSDMDLYFRRADIYYSQNLQFKAGADYLRVLASGDSSKIILKRLGIGLAYNNQHLEALYYLLMAYKKDSTDFEISSYIGQTYFKLKSYKKSIIYYEKVLKLLNIFNRQIDYTNTLIADSYRDSSLYNEAIKYYNKSLNSKYTARICMTIANIYDEDLKNYDKAISYYQLFMNNLDKSEFNLGPVYIENVKKRLDWLIENKDKKTFKK